MSALDFRPTADDGASGVAVAGRGKWTQYGDVDRRAARLTYRLAHETHILETTLIDRMCASVSAQSGSMLRLLLTDYYVSLKTSPFVILTGNTPEAHTAFVRGVAEALVGTASSQYIQIADDLSWTQETGEGRYYRSLLERFESLRLLDTIQEAGLASNAGKAYFLCLKGLRLEEVNHFFKRLLRLTPEGETRLALPGLSPKQQPLVPANLYITAILRGSTPHERLNQQVLRHASVLDLSPWEHTKAVEDQNGIPAAVGYQRAMLAATNHDVDAARYKLQNILGTTSMAQLRPSPPLARMLWRGGLVLGSGMLRDLTRYVANSFDREGCGLFDRQDRQRNAQMALDLRIVQRMAWSIGETGRPSLLQALLAYRKKLFTEHPDTEVI